MTETEYKHKMRVIETEYSQSKKQLYIDYATSNRIFKVGDIIKNDIGTIIEVQEFGTSLTFGPKPTYIGRELRKDLVPKKNGNIGTIYGNDNVKLLNSVDAVANDFRNDKQSSVVKCCEEANKYIDILAECVHPYASILGDGEMSPAKCLKCGKILSA
jgi:hypothetical protein